MPFKPVILWTDSLIYLLIVLVIAFVFWARRYEHLRAPWRQVVRNRLGMVALLVLSVYVGTGLLDSIHFRTLIQNGQGVHYSNKVKSLLDVVLSPLDTQYERSYSAPFATKAYVKSSVEQKDGSVIREHVPLKYAGQHLSSPQKKWQDIAKRSLQGFLQALFVWLVLLNLFIVYLMWQQKKTWSNVFWDMLRERYAVPWRLLAITSLILFTLLFISLKLAMAYHVLGTDKVGQDVFYQALKSIRTGLVIGTLTTLVMLPFAVLMGTMAGYFKGRIDDIIQYIYTTLSSIPSVLLIAAAILALQVFISNHTDIFPSLEQRADVRLLALCIILGVTSWTSLCRMLRGETLKLTEADYVQASKALGVGHGRIILRHILPNVMHIILITVVLDFSALVLAEAVLSYVGVGVDPSTLSWGNMINAARLELAREPIVWWPLLAAFILMFVLVLAANLFSDAVREAFDPRIRKR